jgi:hypothetical protein
VNNIPRTKHTIHEEIVVVASPTATDPSFIGHQICIKNKE